MSFLCKDVEMCPELHRFDESCVGITLERTNTKTLKIIENWFENEAHIPSSLLGHFMPSFRFPETLVRFHWAEHFCVFYFVMTRHDDSRLSDYVRRRLRKCWKNRVTKMIVKFAFCFRHPEPCDDWLVTWTPQFWNGLNRHVQLHEHHSQSDFRAPVKYWIGQLHFIPYQFLG